MEDLLPSFPIGPQRAVGLPEVSGQPSGMMDQASGGSDKLSQLQNILRLAIPAIAGVGMLKNPNVGGLAHGYAINEQNAYNNRDRDMQRKLQADNIARNIAYQAREEARQHRMEAAQLEEQAVRHQQLVLQDKANKEKAASAAIAARVSPLLKNETFMNNVNENGPEKFSLQVEGIGPVNLRDAFERIGVVKGPDGKYQGEYTEKPAARTPLVTGIGPNGEPVRTEDKPGVMVYQRPRAEKAPADKRRRTAIQRLEDPEQPGFYKSYLVDLDTGEIINEVNPTNKKPTTPSPSKPSGPSAPAAVKPNIDALRKKYGY